MPWFKRRNAVDEQRDPDLPLTVGQAQRLRELVRTAWASAGREVTVHSDHVTDADGAEFGLWNLATLVAEAPARDWPGIVGHHVQIMATPTPSVETMSDDELRGQVMLRLLGRSQLPDPEWFRSSPALGDDLLQVVVVDTPTMVLTPGENVLAGRGDLDEWRAVGRANLWHLMRSERREHTVLSKDGRGFFDVLIGDSVFTASMTLLLAELLSLTGHADAGRGVLVTVPFRHQIAFRVIDSPDAAAALHNLFGFAMAGYDEGAGPISPNVFWVTNGQWRQITTRDGNGAAVHVTPELASALGLPDA